MLASKAMTQGTAESFFMLTNYDPDWNIEDLTDIEIYAVIRYLEPETSSAKKQKQNATTTPDNGVICACLYVAVLISLAFLWFSSR
jgi:hypothetical protein